jgi:uncharacterized membrane protein YgcG
VAAGEAFSRDQTLRLERATKAASGQTGVRFVVAVGSLDGAELVAHTEELLSGVAGPGDLAVVVFVAPAERVVRIATTPAVRTRLSDQACALASLSMTTSFGVGDLVGGIVNGLRMLADAAGRVALPTSAAPTRAHAGEPPT